MPVNSLIVGVDLAPIKPIPRCITFQSDITTDKCRSTIRQHLKTWKADTVLHDGAPNVGAAWVQDAFSQAELVLQAMKLATEFLIEGGTFITKVFRSKDYNSLLWVFNQLFSKVEATKPPSSRTVSAEIFVVCRGYKAPKRIDPKFLDARSVFAELADPTPNHEAKVFRPEIKKRKRDGYEEGDYTQFKEASVNEFVQAKDPIPMLGSLNKLSFDQGSVDDVALAAISQLPETTREIRQCCSDLKVLGRKEFRALLKWRILARERFGLAPKKPEQHPEESNEVAEITPMDEELRMQEDLQRMTEHETARRKKERRRENERKQKEITRMQLHMTVPMDIGMEQVGPSGEDAMFGLKAVDRAGAVHKVARGKMGILVGIDRKASENIDDEAGLEASSDASEDMLERQLDSLYEQYQTCKSEADAKFRARKARKEEEDGEWNGFSGSNISSDDERIEVDSDEDMSDAEDDSEVRALTGHDESQRNQETGLSTRAERFFEQDIFKSFDNLNHEADDGDESVQPPDEPEANDQGISKTSGVPVGEDKGATREQTGTGSDSKPPMGLAKDSSKPVKVHQMDHDQKSVRDDFEVVQKPEDSSQWEAQDEPRKNGRLDIEIITAEAMTLAQKIASGETTEAHILDDAFNKYTFRDRDGLPEWFLDDEDRHSKPHRPITAAAAAAIKEKLRALNARPIKKVREAKDRKRFKAAQRLEKLRKKSALLADDTDLTEKDKAQNITKMMSKAARKTPRKQVKVVVARGGNRGIQGRPKGVKGRYKIVDARLKKDVRAEKRTAKKRK